MTDQNPTTVWRHPQSADERSRPPRPGYANLDGLRYRTGELYDDHGITLLVAEATPETFWLRLVHDDGNDERPDIAFTYTHACYYLNGINTGAHLQAAAKHAHHPDTDRDGTRNSDTSTGGDTCDAVMDRAVGEAYQLGHNYVGTEHLLLALTHDTPTAVSLRALGVDPNTIREHVQTIIGTSDGAHSGIPLSGRVRSIYDYAIDEAARLGHNHLDATHVLLGLLAEGEGVAAQVLNSLGVTLDRARQHHTHPRPAA